MHFRIFELVTKSLEFFLKDFILKSFLGLQVKVTKVTTGHQKWPKIVQNSIISFFCPKGKISPLADGQSSPQEL